MSAASDGSAVPEAGAPARPPPRQAAGFCAGALLVLGLSYLHPLALALGLPLALGAFWLWPLRWALPAALLVAALLLYRGGAALRLPLPGDGALLWLCLLSLIFGIVRALHIDALIREGAARQHLLEELEQTRQELLAGERRAGVLEERQRLARDIHDTLAQGFAGIVMHLEAAEQALPPEARRRRGTSTRRGARRGRACRRRGASCTRCAPSTSSARPCPRPSPASSAASPRSTASPPRPTWPAPRRCRRPSR